jgi:hypothetical protein
MKYLVMCLGHDDENNCVGVFDTEKMAQEFIEQARKECGNNSWGWVEEISHNPII